MNIVQKEVLSMPKIIPNIKETVVIEARKMLIQDGYSSFNMRDIAKQCGIGVGTLYNYFPNKDELVRLIFNEDWNAVINFIRTLEMKNCPLKSKINEIYININNFLQNYLDVFMEMAYSNNKNKCHRGDMMNPVYNSLEAILTFHKNIGELHTEVPLDKLSHFITTNLVTLCRDKYLSFDELYDCFKL
jgi:Transcriptional regulator